MMCDGMETECTCAAKNMPFGRCCKAPASVVLRAAADVEDRRVNDLLRLARTRIDTSQRTHYEGCERDHRECLIQRLADEVERLRGAQNAQRKPLTSAQIRAIECEVASSRLHEYVSDAEAFARAIERAHGID